MKKLMSLGLVLVGIFVLAACSSANDVVASTIAIDVNPSVVLELDEDEKVINVILNNEDAEIIVGDMDLVGVDYDIAINALIGSMVTNGYISELANSVLLSVSNDDEVRLAELMTELSDMVNQVLTGSQIEGAVIVQDLEFEDEAEELAALYEISEAKAELILDIIEEDPRMTVEELVLLSINELNLLLEAKEIDLEDLERTGEASDLALITVEEAYQIALTEFGVEDAMVIELGVELEQEDGVMVFEVEFETESEYFEILINATDGTVYVEVDDDDDDDDEVFPENALSQEQVMELIATEYELDPSLIVLDDFEEEMDNGVAYYEVEFYYGNYEYEFEVDALDGHVYEFSMEHDDDDDEEYEDEQEYEDEEEYEDEDEYEEDEYVTYEDTTDTQDGEASATTETTTE